MPHLSLPLAVSDRYPPGWRRLSQAGLLLLLGFGGLLVGSLLVIHVGTIAVDSFLPFSIVQLVVPFTASYRPLWTGLGVASAELLLALAVTWRSTAWTYEFARRGVARTIDSPTP